MNDADNILKKLVEKAKTPSVQYRFFSRDQIIHRFDFGWADIKNRQLTTPATSYKGYSVTKTFTAVAVLQLYEKNLLNIYHPIREYIPAFPYAKEVTIQQVLSHSAGIPNPIPLSWIHLLNEHETFNRNGFFQNIHNRNKKSRSAPNEKFGYSNLGYVFLGQLIEQLTGLSYEDYIRRHILEKLELKPDDLDFVINSTNLQAKGYHKKYSISNAFLGLFIDKSKFMENTEGPWKKFKDFYTNGVSYGGLIGTADSFVVFVQELLRSQCKLLSDETKRIMFTEKRTNDNKPTGMCLGWYMGKLNGRTFFTHAGGGGGYYCELRIYPEAASGSVIMFNRTGMKDERFLNHVDPCFLK
jgi:CubicO group peptidase (beta-lactamase class C family)